MRKDQRPHDALRPVSLQRGFQPHAYSSILMTMGETQVACAVSLEDSVPAFLKNTGKGWITAEYGMLPCSTHSRMPREAVRGRTGRTYEIQRLIGRALRAMLDLDLLGEVTLRIDCDVLKADGGTRTAAITGAAVALQDAVRRMAREDMLETMPQILPVAAVSVGLVNGSALLDLDYAEDSAAEVDGNFVMTADGRFVEVQSTAEGRPFFPAELEQMVALARKGIQELLVLFEQERK
jgi:ribonuclease PH